MQRRCEGGLRYERLHGDANGMQMCANLDDKRVRRW
jgi:hypothetical protein